MAKLYRRKDSKFWWMAFTINGKSYRLPTRKRKWDEAKQVMDDRVAEAQKGFYNVTHNSRKLTFDQWADQFLEMYSKPPFRTAKTHTYHKNSIKHLKRVFGNRRLTEITPDEIEWYRMKRLAEPPRRGGSIRIEARSDEAKELIKPATVNREIETMRRMYNVAKRKLKLLFNPCDGVEKLNEKRHRRRPHFMTWGEQQKICLAAHGLLRAAIVIITETGMRPYRELTSMRKDSVDLERGVAYVDDTKTENGIREIPLTELSLVDFARLKNNLPESPWLFPSPLKPEQHIASFKSAWKTALRIARVPYFQFYDLRSTFATRLSAGGVPESFVMDLLGQSDPSAMKRYSFARVEQMREALARLNRHAGESSIHRNTEHIN